MLRITFQRYGTPDKNEISTHNLNPECSSDLVNLYNPQLKRFYTPEKNAPLKSRNHIKHLICYTPMNVKTFLKL